VADVRKLLRVGVLAGVATLALMAVAGARAERQPAPAPPSKTAPPSEKPKPPAPPVPPPTKPYGISRVVVKIGGKVVYDGPPGNASVRLPREGLQSVEVLVWARGSPDQFVSVFVGPALLGTAYVSREERVYRFEGRMFLRRGQRISVRFNVCELKAVLPLVGEVCVLSRVLEKYELVLA